MDKIKKIKKQLNTLYLLATVMLTFWIAETVVFLLIEGWHWKATSSAEIYCDLIVAIMCFVLEVLFILLALNTIESYINDKTPEDETSE